MTTSTESQHLGTHCIVERSVHRSERLADFDGAVDFLDACGLQRERQSWHAALASLPVEASGEAIRFIPVEIQPGSSASPDWIAHGYPLQQVRIDLQGTRHSTGQHTIEQLETVLARLRAGDECCRDHDATTAISSSSPAQPPHRYSVTRRQAAPDYRKRLTMDSERSRLYQPVEITEAMRAAYQAMTVTDEQAQAILANTTTRIIIQPGH